MNNTRRLTEGAVMLAIFAVLLMITTYVPLLVIASIWFMPLPFIYIAWKNSWKGIIVFFFASIIISFIIGTLVAILLTSLFGLTGIALGYLVQKNKSRFTILSVASLVFLINTIMIYGAIVTIFEINFFEKANVILNNALEKSEKVLIASGQAKEAEKLKELLMYLLQMTKTLLPSILVVSSFINVYFLQLINFSVLKRFGLNVSHWKTFRELSVPKSILWYYLLTSLLTLFLKPEEGSYIYTALWNVFYILQLLLVFQGIFLIFFVSHEKGWSKAIPIVITVLTFLPVIPIILYIVRILGIIDLGFDFRKRLVKK